jgi:hypothetical protein
MINARLIIKIDKIIGAITGPIHATGIRNNISHVRKDAGQSSKSFRKA